MADRLRTYCGLTDNMYHLDSIFFMKLLVRPFVDAMQTDFLPTPARHRDS